MNTFLIIIGILVLNAIAYLTGYAAGCREILDDIEEMIDDIENNEKGNIE